jgi:hypothetical protein
MLVYSPCTSLRGKDRFYSFCRAAASITYAVASQPLGASRPAQRGLQLDASSKT